MNLSDIIVDRSPLQKSIHVEDLRIELSDLGFTIVSTAWLQNKLVAEKLHKRRMEMEA